ncbi:unnamed protein product [Blumeria hordei]|uniref:Uncharacterized protein n=1 Tax=Blumeria hordei TaxID=2867405 RepID=A0A383UVY1_BLUHO|nr:unnamed protein product [Blumeria hordei]
MVRPEVKTNRQAPSAKLPNREGGEKLDVEADKRE